MLNWPLSWLGTYISEGWRELASAQAEIVGILTLCFFVAVLAAAYLLLKARDWWLNRRAAKRLPKQVERYLQERDSGPGEESQ